MKIRATLAAMVVLASTAVVQVASVSTASAALPRCNSYARQGIGTGYEIQARIPSVGFDGSVDCILRRGDRSDAVRVLQYLIACNDRANNPDGSLRVKRDGDFGSITEQALRLVQGDKHITVDGIYGPQTRNATRWPVFKGNSGWFFYDCY